ncbi:hypothetical protein ABOM_001973 [Aspergillus bombycis]|uniref:Uncharacterized protein n=1 Tax=Aspergillus bombycis TaxID=109264 RepID=A0A1F8AA79_9EURO|nr:hypothetical protein ABOM_001973 [Aspergillus bombycis]OGM48617.1 hypothetical protein ABOM_001973 [Aspergillus bombycis]
MPTSLLDLPSEVLDRIVELVLRYGSPAPEDPLPPLQNYEPRSRQDGSCLSADYGIYSVRYWRDQEKYHDAWLSNPLSLLLVNHRIGEVTKRRLDNALTPSVFKLDVILSDERELHPTWCFLSNPCRHVGDLSVTFHVVGTSFTPIWRRYHLLPDGDSPPRILWAFYYLLERFLEVGPLAEHRIPDDAPRTDDLFFTINRLTLDFVSPAREEMLAPANLSFWSWLNGGADEDNAESHRAPCSGVFNLLMRPEWLADLISEYVGYLLGMSIPMAPYGKLLYEYVGSIRICVDGKVMKEYRLDYRLQDLNYVGLEEDYKRYWDFGRWKEKVYRMRKEAGLPVVIL